MAVDSNGDLFIADQLIYRIRKVSTSGVVTTAAGNGTGTFLRNCSASGHAVAAPGDGPAIHAQLRYPLGVAVDRDGNLFIADAGDNRIRKVSPMGSPPLWRVPGYAASRETAGAPQRGTPWPRGRGRG